MNETMVVVDLTILSTEMKELQKCLRAVYLATEASIADDINRIVRAAIESLQAKTKLQAERIEELETALRDYVRAQSKIDDRWEVSDATVQHQLLRDLHFCEALGREALEALKANAAQPTNKPTDSDGSST